MSKVIVFLLILVAVSSFLIKDKPKGATVISEDQGKDFNEAKKIEGSKMRKESLKRSENVVVGHDGSNLKMSNYTGSCVSSAMVSIYTRAIEDGFKKFQTNQTANLYFIQAQLELTYTKQYFTVVIFNENTTYGGFYLYSTGACTAVSWSGVNHYQPQWVYVITAIPVFYPFALISYLSQGLGIDDNKAKTIDTIITSAEGTGACTCSNLNGVISALEGTDGNKWNVVCKQWRSLTVYGNVRNSANRWYLTAPNNCEYLVWAT